MAGESTRQCAVGEAPVGARRSPRGLRGSTGGIGSDQALTLAGHRDTHFAFLQTLNPGQPLAVQLADGSQQHFQISRQQVINSQQHPLHIPRDDQQLILITCYPFGALTPGGPLRYVVTATSAPTSNAANNHAEQ